MKGSVILSFVSFLSLSVLLQAVDRPNVILFFADDMGYGEVQRFHPERSLVPTPHLNSLCDGGMMFTDAHTTSSVCTPSRYSLLTGRYNWRSPHQFGVTQGGKPCIIEEGRMTLGDLFKSQGYHTAMFGKWHLDFVYEYQQGADQLKYVRDQWNYGKPKGTKILDGPINRGFDHYRGFHHSGSMSSIIVDDEVQEYVECTQIMDHLTDSVVSYIQEKSQSKTPFFVYYPMNSPHAPVVPKEEWKEKGVVKDPWGYSAFVAQTDDTIGQILSVLKDTGIEDDTIILFATDNGCHKSPNYFADQGHDVSGPFRGMKKTLYDGGHRIPFIIKWPGLTKPGTQCGSLVCMTDLFATFAEYFDMKYDEKDAEDSVSFLARLIGQKPEVVRNTIIHHDYHGKFGIREGDFKLILQPEKSSHELVGLEREVQLYNIRNDIGEVSNVANSHPEKVKHLISLLEKKVADGRTTPGRVKDNDVKVDIWKR